MCIGRAGQDTFASTFPLNVSVPVGSRVRVIFVNGTPQRCEILSTYQTS